MKTEITKKFLKDIRPEIDAALAGLAEKHGVKIRAGNATFTGLMATFKLELSSIGEDGTVADKFSSDFMAYARSCGGVDNIYSGVVVESNFGREFKYGSTIYKICGLRAQAHKAIVAVSTTGQKSGFSTSLVAQLLAVK